MDYTSIITLVIGAILGFGVEKFVEELRFRKVRRYFFYVLYELTKSVESQINHYKTYIESIDKETNHFRILKTDVGYSLDKINIISKEDLYKIFISRHKRVDKRNYYKRFTVLTNGFNLIQHHNKIDDIQDTRLLELNNRLLLQFSESLKKVNKDIDIYLAEYENKNDPSYVDFKKKVLDLRESVFKNFDDPEYSIYKHTGKYVLPLLDIVKEFDIVELIHELSAIYHTFSELNANRKSVVAKLNDDVMILERMYVDYMNTLFLYKKYLIDVVKSNVKIIN